MAKAATPTAREMPDALEQHDDEDARDDEDDLLAERAPTAPRARRRAPRTPSPTQDHQARLARAERIRLLAGRDRAGVSRGMRSAAATPARGAAGRREDGARAERAREPSAQVAHADRAPEQRHAAEGLDLLDLLVVRASSTLSASATTSCTMKPTAMITIAAR